MYKVFHLIDVIRHVGLQLYMLYDKDHQTSDGWQCHFYDDDGTIVEVKVKIIRTPLEKGKEFNGKRWLEKNGIRWN